MTGKRVKFNIKTATCDLCSNLYSTNSDDVKEAEKYCKTCQKFMCKECLKRHRKLVVTENHKILNRDHVVLDENDDKYNEEDDIRTEVAEFSVAAEKVIEEYAAYRKQTIEAWKEVVEGPKQDVTDRLKQGREPTNETRKEGSKQVKNEDEDLAQKWVHEPTHDFTEECKEHASEKIKFYCVNHRALCCVACKRTQHKTCMSSVKFIPELNSNSLTWENNITCKTLTDEISKSREYDHQLKRDLRELKKSKENFLRDLTEIKCEILNWVDLMEVRAVRRLEMVFEKYKHEIDNKSKKAKGAFEKLRAESYFLKGILTNENHNDIYKFIKDKQAEKLVQEIANDRTSSELINTRFTLEINKDFRSLMTDINQLYELKFEDKGEDKFSVRLKGDLHTCNITGCTCLATGNIVLADRSNAKIKIYGPHMKLMSSFKVPDGVFDVIDIPSNMIAVTCPLKSRINVIELRQSKFKSKKSVCTGNGTCWGVKYVKGKFIVNVSTADASYIRVLTEDGDVMSQIKTQCGFYSAVIEESRDGKPLISIVTAASHALVPKTEKKDVLHYVQENKGNSEFQVLEYNYLNHLHVKGVTLDRGDNPVVCCSDTDQVYTIAKSGTEAELMLAESDGLCRPQALCYTKDKTRLVVASEYTDFLQIFAFDTGIGVTMQQ